MDTSGSALDNKEKPLRLLYATNQYNEKVLISNWDISKLAEPKDYDPYGPQVGSNFISTYKRIENTYNETPTSETHDMLKQVLSKVDNSAIYQSNPLHNLLSYNVKEKEFCEDDLRENYVSKYPPNYDMVDYRTSMQRDYRPLQLIPKKPVSKVSQPRAKNVRCLSELSDAGSAKRHGTNKFLDDGLEDFYTNKHLRWDRYSSYDPATERYTAEKYHHCSKQQNTSSK